jgi:hypothetical protein
MGGEKVVRFSNRTRPARTAGLIIPPALCVAVSALNIGVFWAAIIGLAAALCAWGALLVSLLSDGYAIQSERSEERGRPPASWPQ